MTFVLYCALCGVKAASGLKNKTARALCTKHLNMARFMDALIDDRVYDMPADFPPYLNSEVTRAR